MAPSIAIITAVFPSISTACARSFTDVAKISDAIISRCATYHLSLPSEEEIVAWLQKILSSEGSEASEEALSIIASKASYRPREALILLEKIINADPDQHLSILQNAPTIPPSLRMGNNGELCDDKRFNRSLKSGLFSTVAKFFTPRDTLQAIEKYVCSAGNLLDRVFPPKQIYVSPLIDGSSLTMVYAEAGVGKSWFV